MDNRFVHVGFVFPGAIKMRDLEPAFSLLGDDWIRYSALSWMIWTNKSTPEIYSVLLPFLDAKDQVLVVGIDHQDAFGFLSPWFGIGCGVSSLPERFRLVAN